MAEEQLTLFDLPNRPDEIGVSLVPAKLRRLDHSALDFPTARRAMLEYIMTYFPDEFNDYVTSNGMVMLIELMASNVSKLALRADILANEAFLPTARTEEAVTSHLNLINQRILPQTPAVVDVEVSVVSPLSTDLIINPGIQFQVRGPDQTSIYYELFRAPGDYTNPIVIPAGKRGVIALGLEGRFASDLVLKSPGGSNQMFQTSAERILETPIQVSIDTGSVVENWTVTTEPLERFGAKDQVVQVRIFSNRAEFYFGDDINGKAPLAGQSIRIRYRTGGGIRGRIGSNAINESRAISPAFPAVTPVSVLFRNLGPSSGGTDRESLERAKRRAPRDFAVRAFASDRPASIVTSDDYAQVASTFTHPVYGSVAKALATIRTGFNANRVEIYALANGADGLVTPSVGLKQGLKTYLSEFNVLTDTVEILDGSIKVVDVDMTVAVSRNADGTFVSVNVNAALDNFFNINNWEMGQALHLSDLVEAISAVDGVDYVDIFSPNDNILSTRQLADPDVVGVGLNEIIVEGSRNVKVFYSRSR